MNVMEANYCIAIGNSAMACGYASIVIGDYLQSEPDKDRQFIIGHLDIDALVRDVDSYLPDTRYQQAFCHIEWLLDTVMIHLSKEQIQMVRDIMSEIVRRDQLLLTQKYITRNVGCYFS